MCTRPLKGWAAIGGGFTFNASRGWTDRPLTIPCNSCIECRGVVRFGKAIRVCHELEMDPGHRGCFVTLTYDPDNIPASGLLQVEDLQKFLKRIRQRVDNRLSYLAVGEYGTNYGRPHYHLCLVGYEPDVVMETDKDGLYDRYSDPLVQRCWTAGSTYVGTLTPSSAMYTAKYVVKDSDSHSEGVRYGDVPARVGDRERRERPEFALHSTRPALGRTFVEKYWRDIYEADFDAIVWDGIKVKPPRYYDKWLSEHQPVLWQKVKARRLELRQEDATYRELFAREVTKTKNMKMFAKDTF